MTDPSLHPLDAQNLELVTSILRDTSPALLVFLRGQLTAEKIIEVGLGRKFTSNKLSKMSFAAKLREFEASNSSMYPNYEDAFDKVMTVFEILRRLNQIRNEIAHEIKTFHEFLSSVLNFSDLVMRVHLPKTYIAEKSRLSEMEYIEYALVMLCGRVSAVAADLLDLDFDSNAAHGAVKWVYFNSKDSDS